MAHVYKEWTCLAQHVGGDGDGWPDGRVDSEKDHPEHHASPYRQVGKLQQSKRDREKKKKKKKFQREGVQERIEIKRQRSETA